MIPTGVSAVVAFIFFVIPGLIWELLVERRKPSKDESAFREASRVALVSTPFSILATAIVAVGTQLANSNWLNLANNWVTSGTPSSGESILVVALMALAELTLALILVAIVWNAVGDRVYGSAVVLKESAWTYALGNAPEGFVSFATVRTNEGVEYRGQVLVFTNNYEWTDREITLSSPLTVRHPGGGLNPMSEQYVTIPSTNIGSISSLYVRQSIVEEAQG